MTVSVPDKLQLLLFTVFCIFKSSEQDTIFEDLKQINISCHSQSECQDLKQGCYFDDACIEYGDCCQRAPLYDQDRMIDSLGQYECIHVPSANNSVYMKGKCKVGWENQQVEKLCLKGYYGISYENQLNFNPIIDTPLTSFITNITYKNYYCALCNGEFLSNIKVWNPRFTCYFISENEYSNINSSTLLANSVKVNGTHGIYINNADGISEFRKCVWHSFIPAQLMDKVRTCNNYVGTCSLNWTNLEVKKLCYSYTLMVHHLNVTYRNHHCALCNFVKDTDILSNRATTEPTFEPQLNTLYFSPQIGWTNCSPNQIRHPYITECVNMSNLAIANNFILSCPWKSFIHSKDIIKGPRLSIFVNSTQQLYKDGEYEDTIDGVLVCSPINNYVVQILAWLMLIGLSLSIISLILHLLAFAFIPSLRNLGGRNVAMLCIALLLSNACFLRNAILPRPVNVECKILASATYYFFFAAVVWMSVVSFDVWFALWLATTKLRLTSGKQLKKFIFYSIFAWTLPGIALVVVLVIDYTEPSFVSKDYLPFYGDSVAGMCWLSKGRSSLFYFGAPAATFMIINLIFFLMAIGVMISAKKTSGFIVSRPLIFQLKLYGKFFVLMGLGWVVYFFSEFIPSNVGSSLIFLIMFSYQGVFIFLAYTCTSKVKKYLKKKLNLGKKSKVPLGIEANKIQTPTNQESSDKRDSVNSQSGNSGENGSAETNLSSSTYL